MSGRDNRRRHCEDATAAGEILAKVMSSLGLDAKLKEREALTLWATIVGEEVARRSQALRIREGVIYVRVGSAAWRQELHFLKGSILEAYAKKLGPDRVRDIRFVEH